MPLPTHIIPGPLMLKKGFGYEAQFQEEDDAAGAEEEAHQRPQQVAGRSHVSFASMHEEEGGDEEAEPVHVASYPAQHAQEEEEDDGLTQAQRDMERKKKRTKRDDTRTHEERVEQFNAKLAKQTDINEMPRISG
jgi:molecular chaperone GrpE (heat shock protein)